jgi:RND superfamily putative drug exporter
VLVVAFGTVVAALVPIALALVAVAAGLSAVTLLAGAMEVSTAAPTIAAMVGLGVGIDYALFIVSRYREKPRRGRPERRRPVPRHGHVRRRRCCSPAPPWSCDGRARAHRHGGAGLHRACDVAGRAVRVATALTLLPALLSLLGTASTPVAWSVGTARPARSRRRRGGGWRTGSPPSVALPARVVGAPARAGGADAGDGDQLPRRRRRADEHDAPPGARPARRGLRARASTPRCSSSPTCGGPGLGVGDVPSLVARLQADPGVAEVGEPRLTASGDTVVVPAIPTTAPADDVTAQTLERLRADAPRRRARDRPGASAIDLDEQLADTLPLLLGAVLARRSCCWSWCSDRSPWPSRRR